jgi:hypothetical protein
VLWPEDKTAPREWVLKNARGVQGMIIMSSDKVRTSRVSLSSPLHLFTSRLTKK